MGKFFVHFWRVAPCLLVIIVDYMGYGLVYPLGTIMFNESGIPIFPHLNSIPLKDFYMGLAYLCVFDELCGTRFWTASRGNFLFFLVH